MASTARSRARSTSTPKPTAAEKAAAKDEAKEDKSVSLSHEDFENNPAVIDMAAQIDAADAVNDANARRIIEADRDKPATSPFSHADTAVPDGDDDEEDEDESGLDENQPSAPITSDPDAEKPTVVAAAAPPKGSKVVTLGDRLKNGGRAPQAVTVIIPRDDTAADDPNAVITDGITVQLARGRATRLSAKSAAWLAKHPLFDIQSVTVEKAD